MEAILPIGLLIPEETVCCGGDCWFNWNDALARRRSLQGRGDAPSKEGVRSSGAGTGYRARALMAIAKILIVSLVDPATHPGGAGAYTRGLVAALRNGRTGLMWN